MKTRFVSIVAAAAVISFAAAPGASATPVQPTTPLITKVGAPEGMYLAPVGDAEWADSYLVDGVLYWCVGEGFLFTDRHRCQQAVVMPPGWGGF